jgi:hypothetical protein
MSHEIVIAYEERDALLAHTVSEALEAKGRSVWIAPRGVDEDGELDAELTAALADARLALVIVAEGRAGGGLLRAVEERVRTEAVVLPFVGDSSAIGVSSLQTQGRVARAGETVARMLGAARATPSRSRRYPRVLAALVAAAALIGVIWALWPSGPPVVLTGMLSNQGWMVNFHLREAATEIEYRRAGDADFVPLGPNRDLRREGTNTPLARTFVALDDLRGRVPFEVRYRNTWGRLKGPYPVVFDADAEAVASVKNVLTMVPGWVSLRLFNGKNLCYFSTLLSYKYALREIRYGVDADGPDRSVTFKPSDRPGIADGDLLYVELPREASFVTVELTFLDGTREKRRFPARAE